eukprot:COSAG02_NODE_55_length_43887_cov_30.660364_10_plen_474_part_00
MRLNRLQKQLAFDSPGVRNQFIATSVVCKSPASKKQRLGGKDRLQDQFQGDAVASAVVEQGQEEPLALTRQWQQRFLWQDMTRSGTPDGMSEDVDQVLAGEIWLDLTEVREFNEEPCSVWVRGKNTRELTEEERSELADRSGVHLSVKSDAGYVCTPFSGHVVKDGKVSPIKGSWVSRYERDGSQQRPAYIATETVVVMFEIDDGERHALVDNGTFQQKLGGTLCSAQTPDDESSDDESTDEPFCACLRARQVLAFSKVLNTRLGVQSPLSLLSADVCNQVASEVDAHRARSPVSLYFVISAPTQHRGDRPLGPVPTWNDVVDQVDWARLVRRVMHDRCLWGYCRGRSAKAERLVLAYRDFLRHKTALRDWTSTKLSPPFPKYKSGATAYIDAVWHIHLSNPEDYTEDMAILTGGRIIEHHPVPLSAAIEEGRIQRCYDMQVQLMEQQGRELDEMCWLDPESSNMDPVNFGCC